MARFADVNLVYATNNEVFFQFKEKMKAAGFTVTQSSDGLTYSSSGDVITHFSTGAGGLNNARAFFILREPGGRREYCFQRNSSTVVRIKYSALARFVTGSPSATVTPDATDEQTMHGGGTSAAPTFATFFGADGTYKTHHVIESTPVNGAYFWACYGTLNVTGVTQFVLFADPIQAGTHSSEDADPIALTFGPYNADPNPRGWAYFGSAAPVWQTLAMFVLGPVPAAGTADPIARDPVISAMYYSSTHWKGIGAFLKGKTMSRIYPSTINRDTDCYVYVRNSLYPFKNGVDPVL
jgi:hypothetical protein